MLKLTNKILAIGLVFVGPLVVVISRYATNTEVRHTLGIVPLIFLLTIVGITIRFVTSQLIEMVRRDRFGWLSITFFGLLLALILFGSWFVLNYVTQRALQDLTSFVDTFEYHKDTLLYMMMFIGAGLGLGGVNVVVSYQVKKAIKEKTGN